MPDADNGGDECCGVVPVPEACPGSFNGKECDAGSCCEQKQDSKPFRNAAFLVKTESKPAAIPSTVCADVHNRCHEECETAHDVSCRTVMPHFMRCLPAGHVQLDSGISRQYKCGQHRPVYNEYLFHNGCEVSTRQAQRTIAIVNKCSAAVADARQRHRRYAEV